MSGFWRLPGPSRWLAGLEGERQAGTSGVLICPSDDRPPDLAVALADMTPRQVSHHQVQSDDAGCVAASDPLSAHVRLLSVLSDRLGLDTGADAVALTTHPNLGRQGLVVDARCAPLAVQSAWAAVAADIAEAARSLVHTSRPTLWILVAPEHGRLPTLPRPDVCLIHRWYWGVLGPVDTLVASADAGLDDDLSACALEVVRWDLHLLNDLADWDGTVSGLASREVRWPAADGKPLPGFFEPGDRPSADVLPEWSAGLIERWDGQVSCHLALDRAHRADATEIRVWAGQVARVLPFIELERARLASWFAGVVARHGGPSPHWSDDLSGDIASLEIGPLWACVLAHRSIGVPRQRLDLLRDLKDARNAIAHRRPVAPATVRDLRRRAAADRAVG